MAQRSRFWDSVAGDRVYDSAAMAQVLATLSAPDGVFVDYANAMQVTANSPAAMNVVVATGACFAQGRLLEVYTGAETLTIAASHATLNRIDVIVARITFASRLMELAVVQGTNGASPSAPALTQDGTTWEIALAEVYVAATVTSILNARITDRRTLLSTGKRSFNQWHSVARERAILCFSDWTTWASTGAGGTDAGSLGMKQYTTGSAGAGSRAASSNVINGKVDLSTTAAINRGTGLGPEIACARGDLNPRYMTSLIPQAPIANLGIQFWGFYSATLVAAGTGNSKAGFRSTGTGNMFAVTGNGATEQTTDLGVSPTTQTQYEVRTDDDGVTWKFYVNGTLVASHATTIPVASTSLIPVTTVVSGGATDCIITNIDYTFADQDRS